MKLQSFYLPIAVFICVCITFVSVIDANVVIGYNANVLRGLAIGDTCRLWVTDQNNNLIAGDDNGNYHDCFDAKFKNMTVLNTSNYWVHANVQGSTRKTKNRGPFNDDVCFRIHGDIISWWFDEGCD